VSVPPPPIDRAAAEQIAREAIRTQAAPDADVVVMTEHTLERPVGWVFFYNTRAFVETGDFSQSLIGNAPVLVDRCDGSVHFIATSRPVEDAVAEYASRTAGGSGGP
jgi:hypothetical protein